MIACLLLAVGKPLNHHDLSSSCCYNVSHHHSYISCVVGCPYEGKVAPEKVAYVSAYLISAVFFQ